MHCAIDSYMQFVNTTVVLFCKINNKMKGKPMKIVTIPNVICKKYITLQ